MQFATKRHSASGVVSLQNAVLCLDCESVSDSRSDECPKCGGHSLLGLAHVLGGSLADHKGEDQDRPKTVFDLEMVIELKQIEPANLNAFVEGISDLIGTKLGRGRATFHLDVEPVTPESADETAEVLEKAA